jgi:hypothetical protein
MIDGIEVNTSISAVMAMGSQFSRRGEEFARQAEDARQKVTELVTDPATFGQDKLGETMRTNHPDPVALAELYRNHEQLGEAYVQAGDAVRTVMSYYEAAEHDNEGAINKLS